MAITPELQSYLENCKSQGLPFSAVKDLLAQAGWSMESLSTAEAWYTGHPSAIPDVNSVVSRNGHKGKSVKTLVLILFIFVLSLFITGSVSAYLIATDKLPFPNSDLKNRIVTTVFTLPFIPKTPEIVLGLTASAHSSLTKNSFDMSVAVGSTDPGFAEVLGASNLDFIVRGDVDYTNLQSPLANMQVEVNKDFKLDIRSKDQKVYLKLNQVPVFASAGLAVFGIKPEAINPLLEANWILLDGSINRIPSTIVPTTAPAQEEWQKLIKEIFAQDIAPNLQVSKTTLDTTNVYKIEFNPSPELLDRITKKIAEHNQKDLSPLLASNSDYKPSENYKNIKLTAYIDQKSHYLLQLDTSLDFIVPDSKDVVKILSVLKLSNFNKSFQVDVPENTIPAEEFMNQVFNLSEGRIPDSL